MKLDEVLSPHKSRTDYDKNREKKRGGGIAHIEDAEVQQFINTIENLSHMIVSEKLDGANMIIGLDEEGKFYTGRANHKGGGERFRTPKDWINAFGSTSFAPNGFSSAHQALNRYKAIIENILQPKEIIEAEILYGTIPNAVAYDGKNYIAFLRVVEGPEERIAELESAFKGKKTVVFSDLLTTNKEAIVIERQKQNVEWNFTSTQFIDKFDLEKVKVEEQLSKLKTFINLPAKGFSDFTNCEILSVPLTIVPRRKRERFKEAREKVGNQIMTEFKLPIKEELLNQLVRKLGPKLGRSAEEGGWIEGVVILDPKTKRQLKIVDKDMFTTVNNFIWEVRSAVAAKAAGAKQLNVSVVGKYTQALGEIFGIPNLFIPAQTSRILKKLDSKDSEEALSRLVGSLPKGQDLNTYEADLLNLVSETTKELDVMLKWYKQERDKMTLEVSSGPVKKTFSFNKEVDYRTLQVFAETRAEISKLGSTVENAESIGEVLAVLLHNRLRTL